MKKMMMVAIAAMMATALSAQTLIKANYQKGNKATYEISNKSTTTSPMGGGSVNANVSWKAQYEVLDATAEGAEISVLLSDIKTDGEVEMLGEIGQMLAPLSDKAIIFKTDANGKPVSINDYETIAGELKAALTASIDAVLKEHPEAAQAMDADKMKAAIADKVNEKAIFDIIAGDVFELNGETITTGQEVEKVEQGVKTKTTYTLTPILGTKVIVAKGKAAMNEEETKAFLIGQMRENGVPEEQLKMMEDNWSQFVAMGMAKVDITSDATSKLLGNGWLQSYEQKDANSIMGADIKSTSTITLTEKNF